MKIAVVGAGIIGLTTMYHLLRDGHEVVVVDAGRPGSGASHGNAGWIVPCDAGPVAAPGMVLQGLKWMLRKDSPLYVQRSLRPDFLRFMLAMARRSNSRDFRAALQANLALAEGTTELLDEYAADGIDFELHRQGLIMAFVSPAALAHHQSDFDLLTVHGRDPHVLTGQELAEQEPALRPTLAGGLHFPHEMHLRPDELVASLASRIGALGGVLRLDEPVTADAYLLAAGAHTGPLSARFGAPIPVRPGKGYSVDYRPAPVTLRSAVNLSDAKVAVTPFGDRLRLAGTMEFAGLDTTVNPIRVSAIRRAPSRYFVEWDPGLEPSTGPWAGMRPMTPDGLPALGRLPGLANAWVAAGHGMLGITLGPGTGRVMAQAIGSGATPEMMAPFDPRRFRSARGRAVSYPRRVPADR